MLVRGATPAAALPAGFTEQTVFSGLTNPTAFRFASDGRVFVAEKSGLIKVFDSLTDTTPTTFADLRTNVHNFWDRGLLGLELHPSFLTQPYVYVLYTHDAAIGGTAPRWGSAGVTSDPCPTPPGPTNKGCVVSGRLSRLQAEGDVMTGSEQVLIEDWCQQYPSHSVGALAFGADGALYVTGGDGASFTFTDYGQDGTPVNPCGDPPGGVGAALTPPTAEGGALRSQDLRTSGDPVGLNGAVLRVDPTTGAGLPDNPLAGDSDANARRIIAYGLRNPFRVALRPGTNELWIGDVGAGSWEEIDRVVNPTDAVVENFGWPCYEGNGRQSGFDAANLNICENLYGQAGAHTQPFFTYEHFVPVVPDDGCGTGSSSIAGLAFEFYSGGAYPAEYQGALFFADYSRDCIWVIRKGANNLPDLSTLATFVSPAANPVDVQMSPSGELYYADFDGGTIRRIRYSAGNQPPTAVAAASPTSGPAPLTVNCAAAGSPDADPGDTLSYAWDLDGDGSYDDSTAEKPTRTYTAGGAVTVGLRVDDGRGGSDTDTVLISVGNTPPSATIAAPTSTTTWKVADVISFSGSATDAEDGPLPAAALSWELILHHCPATCHTHTIQTFGGVASGSFTAPDHEYPSHLELRLTATDSSGLSDVESVQLDPQTVSLSFQSSPTGLQLVVGSAAGTTPFSRTVIVGSRNSLSAPTPQTLGATTYTFSSWSDSGAQTHDIIAPAVAATYAAAYAASAPSGLVAAYAFEDGGGTTITDASGNGRAGTITGATWSTAGRSGGALSFDGVNDWVTIADHASLDLTTGMTLEAWVRPTALGTAWRTVVLKEQPGELVYALYAHDGAVADGIVFTNGTERHARGAAAIPLNAWTHLAATYDGAAVRLYVNGAQVGTFTTAGAMPNSSGVLRIGGNAVWPEWFAGLIDDVRVYNRALGTTEIQSDMNTSVGPPPAPDTSPPSAPTLTANGGIRTVSLSWTASTDDVGVLRYNVHRSTVAGSTPTTANRIAQQAGTSYTDSGLAPGTYFYRVVAEDAAGNFSTPSNEASGTAAPDAPPTVSITAPAEGVTVSATINVAAAASDDVGVAAVRFTLDGADIAEDATAPYEISWDTRSASNGDHTLRAVARDTAGQLTISGDVTVTVSNAAPPSGLVAAYSFDAGSGTTVADASGNGRLGTITGATWSTAGRYGSALSFDGVNDWVTVADHASLDLTTGMTLEAWVRPTALGTSWRTVILKEQPGELVYALYAHDGVFPQGIVFTGGTERHARATAAIPPNAWTHLAATYDGAVVRLYVNGTQAASFTTSGAMLSSTGVLRIGGNAVWPEWFAGLIDDVRVYNRALTAAQIQTDLNTSV